MAYFFDAGLSLLKHHIKVLEQHFIRHLYLPGVWKNREDRCGHVLRYIPSQHDAATRYLASIV